MATRTLLCLAILTASAALSGCSTPAPQTDSKPDVPVVTASGPIELNKTAQFGWEAGAGVPATALGGQIQSTNGMQVAVPKGATHMTIVASWTCTSATCNLLLETWKPGGGPNPLQTLQATPAAKAEGPSPLTLEVASPPEGTWTVDVQASGASVGTNGVFLATVVGNMTASDLGQ